jgi:subtilisin family serine protease
MNCSKVVSSGIMCNHSEFENRAVHGRNTMAEEPEDDLSGHGTFVAGVIGGMT